MTFVLLSLASSVAWFFSTLAGGGSPLILIPLVNFLLGSAAVPPIITLGMLAGNAQRAWLYWRDNDWQVTAWFLPGAIAGAILGAYTFTQIHLEWMQILIGLFLILLVISYASGKKESIFNLKVWYFLPLAFLKSFVSGMIGSTGPILNSFFLSYGLEKEQMVATKAVNFTVLHLVKIITYISLGAMTPEYFGYGLIIGVAAFPGNLLGQYVLSKMSVQQFRQVVLTFMAITGFLMVWQQRQLFGMGGFILGIGNF